MPFGWRNGPPVFQRAMQEILSPFLWVFTLVYIDDIVLEILQRALGACRHRAQGYCGIWINVVSS